MSSADWPLFVLFIGRRRRTEDDVRWDRGQGPNNRCDALLVNSISIGRWFRGFPGRPITSRCRWPDLVGGSSTGFIAEIRFGRWALCRFPWLSFIYLSSRSVRRVERPLLCSQYRVRAKNYSLPLLNYFRLIILAYPTLGRDEEEEEEAEEDERKKRVAL